MIFAENLPVLYFVAPRLYMAVSTRVGGLSPSILRPQLLWNVDQMTVNRKPLDRLMGRYLLRRLGFAVVLVFVVSSAALLLTRIAPGDFATIQGLDLTAEQRAQLRASLGLDRSLASQYLVVARRRRALRLRPLAAVFAPGQRPRRRARAEHRRPRDDRAR